MTNNPFEVDDKKQKRNPFETSKSKKKRGFLINIVIVAVIFVIIYNVNIFINRDTTAYTTETQEPFLSFEEDNSTEEMMSFEELAANGTDASLTADNSQECLLYDDECSKYYAGSEFNPGLYTITMNYATEEDNLEPALIKLEFDLSDYFGITHDTLSDYFDFDLSANDTITIQNIPMQSGSVITAFDQLSNDKVTFELTPQTNTIPFDFNNPIPGLYVAEQDIALGTYNVSVNTDGSMQTNKLEYVPTTYQNDEYIFLYDDGDKLDINKNSAIMYYDTETTIEAA